MTNIYDDIPDCAMCASNKLALGVGRKLAVQTPDYAFLVGHALVVLYKNLFQSRLRIAFGIVGFGKKAA